MAGDYKPDVIFLDLKMPEPDGFSVVHALREAGCEAKVIAMTGYGISVFAETPSDAGFDAVLTKPATAEEIAAILSPGRTIDLSANGPLRLAFGQANEDSVG